MSATVVRNSCPASAPTSSSEKWYAAVWSGLVVAVSSGSSSSQTGRASAARCRLHGNKNVSGHTRTFVCCGSSASRRPSPMKLMVNAIRMMNSPGK
jgi:hypothetical protein